MQPSLTSSSVRRRGTFDALRAIAGAHDGPPAVALAP